MSLTDSRRMWVLLRDAGDEGVHSHTLRHKGVSGNPSQRAKDIVSHGVAVWTARENVGRRPGARYWLREFAPDWAVPVKPNRATERLCACGCGKALDGLRTDARWYSDACRKRAERPASPDKARTGDTSSDKDPERDGGPPPCGPALASGSITSAPPDTPEPVAIVRDYTDPEGRWREIPVSELGEWRSAA